eukprot:COSAG06_NODE_16441_length_1001_cov_1.773836_2_plen_157_part_00
MICDLPRLILHCNRTTQRWFQSNSLGYSSRRQRDYSATESWDRRGQPLPNNAADGPGTPAGAGEQSLGMPFCCATWEPVKQKSALPRQTLNRNGKFIQWSQSSEDNLRYRFLRYCFLRADLWALPCERFVCTRLLQPSERVARTFRCAATRAAGPN